MWLTHLFNGAVLEQQTKTLVSIPKKAMFQLQGNHTTELSKKSLCYYVNKVYVCFMGLVKACYHVP